LYSLFCNNFLVKADGKKPGYIVPVDAPDPDKDKAGFINRAMSMRDIEGSAC
jgi:hypothetical protein